MLPQGRIDSQGVLIALLLSGGPRDAGSIQERNFSGLTEILLLSGSLLGTRAHLADGSSRSRLCWLQLFPVLFTDHSITAHYSSFSFVSYFSDRFEQFFHAPGQRRRRPIDCLRVPIILVFLNRSDSKEISEASRKSIRDRSCSSSSMSCSMRLTLGLSAPG